MSRESWSDLHFTDVTGHCSTENRLAREKAETGVARSLVQASGQEGPGLGGSGGGEEQCGGGRCCVECAGAPGRMEGRGEGGEGGEQDRVPAPQGRSQAQFTQAAWRMDLPASL